MQSFWPSREEFLSRPKRVSRFFVILFIFSATLNALLGFTYLYRETAWQTQKSKYEQLVQSNLDLANEYKAERDDLQVSVAEKNVQLTKLNQELKTARNELAKAEQSLATLNDRIKLQEAQLASNSDELESLRGRPPLFKVESLTSRDVTADKAEVRSIVESAYDVIDSVYGNPYLLNQITINFVDSFNIAGAVGEISIANSEAGIEITIKLRNFDKDSSNDVNTIVHEIIHGFHGIAALNAPVLEEGITVAATDVVMRKMYEQGIINFNDPYITISDEIASQINSSYSTPSGNSSFYSSSNVGVYYQLAGWSWYQLYEEDANFFKNFNNSLYNLVQNGTRVSASGVRNLIKNTVNSANSQSISDFVSSQISFNPS